MRRTVQQLSLALDVATCCIEAAPTGQEATSRRAFACRDCGRGWHLLKVEGVKLTWRSDDDADAIRERQAVPA